MFGKEEPVVADVISALTTACTTISTNFFSALGDILPIALGIVGAGIVVILGVRYFKKIANK